MVKAVKVSGIFFILFFIYYAGFLNLKNQREQFLENNFINYTLPSKFTGMMALEFKGLMSDFLLFKFMAFLGGRTQDIVDNNPRYWPYIYTTLDTITDLDPYYWDAYLFSEMFLAWNSKIEDANKILNKGRQFRPLDYHLPYYMGFNYYYFKKDNLKGSKYLMEASKLPGCPYYISSLAARLSLYSFEHKAGIRFLKEMLTLTKDERAKKEFTLRLTTLEILDNLENKITQYHAVLGQYPASLEDLVKAGFIDKIPKDPYGGEFIIINKQRVYTTSKMLPYGKKQSKP